MTAAALALAAGVAPARSEPATIGIAAPAGDMAGLLGDQLLAGVRAFAHEEGGGVIRLDIADTACSAQGGEAAAQHFADEAVPVVVGFLCTEAIEAALPILTASGIPVVTPGVRTDSLTDKRSRTGWLVYRLAPRADAERQAVASLLVERWREALFAVVDDGTIYGRELAESFRAAAEAQGLEPVYVDTYRPQMDNQIGLAGRLRKAGATHVLAGGDRADIAIIGRDAAKLGYELTIAGGEALRAEGGTVPLAKGTLMVATPRWKDIAPEEVVEALRRQGSDAQGYAIPGYSAMQVVRQALEKSEREDMPVVDILSEAGFQTAMGPVRFDAKGDLERDLYRLFIYDGKEFVSQ